MMKKLMSLVLALLMALSLAACGGTGGGSQPAQSGGGGSTDAKWPEKEIKIIQPWSLGGGPDVHILFVFTCIPLQEVFGQ